MRNVKMLKKIVIFILAITMVFGQTGIKADAKITYKVYYKGHQYKYTGKSYKVYYNNRLISRSDRPGMKVNGNIMIPYRHVLVKNGPKVSYSYEKTSKKLTLTYKGKQIILYNQSKTCYLNGIKQKLRTNPFNANLHGTYCVMVPAKAVIKTLGLGYSYDKKKAAIYITDPNPAATTQTTAIVPPASNKAAGTTADTGSSLNATYTSLTAVRFKNLTTSQFIQLLGPIARESYKKTGILASVTLAQAILESGWGKSDLAQRGNNMFGMKAIISGNTWKGSTWDGKSSIRKRTGEEYGGRKVKITATFRAYKTVYQSILDHSAYLLNAKNCAKNRYAGLTATNSYAKQIQIIKKGGYATSSSYVNSLTRLIRTYHLTKFDVK